MDSPGLGLCRAPEAFRGIIVRCSISTPSLLLVFAVAPLLIQTRRGLRNAALCGLGAILVASVLFLLLPLVFPAKAFKIEIGAAKYR
jgi:hypothetical protein